MRLQSSVWLILGVRHDELRHTLRHFLHCRTLVGKVSELTTVAAVDLRLVKLAAVLLLIAAATGAAAAPRLFSNLGLPLGTREPRLDAGNQQLRLPLPVTTPPL
jgi:hypothetical protein